MEDEITDEQFAEGISFDTEPVDETPEPDQEPVKPAITQEQYEAAIADKARLEKELNDRNEPAYKDLRSKYDTVIDRHAKVIKAVKDNGVGDIDSDTGAIVIYKDKPAVVEPEVKVDPVEVITAKIKTEAAELEEKYSDGTITESEYTDGKLAIDDLREERIRLKQLKAAEPVAPKKEVEQVHEVKAPEPVAEVDAKQLVISKGFYDLATDYPDSVDSKSQLFQKMSEIYDKDPRYALAHPGEQDQSTGEIKTWTGNPKVREMLIEQAAQELEQEGKAKRDQFKKSVKQDFTSPDSQSYTKEVVVNELTEHQTRVATNIVGTKNKAVLDDIKAKIAGFDTNLSITFY